MINLSSSETQTAGTDCSFDVSGAVIGRGGEQITRIQLESGCKIQIAAGEFDVALSCCGESCQRLKVCCVCRQRRSDGAAVFADWNSREHRVSSRSLCCMSAILWKLVHLDPN